jgi:hypothetical protein
MAASHRNMAKESHLKPRKFFVPHRPWYLAGHMFANSLMLLPLGLVTLGMGMAIYHWVEGLAWSDAFLNAAMLLGGMGPVDPLHTQVGKWLAGLYALFAGVVFLVLAGVMLAPVIHHVLARFHVDTTDDSTQ